MHLRGQMFKSCPELRGVQWQRQRSSRKEVRPVGRKRKDAVEISELKSKLILKFCLQNRRTAAVAAGSSGSSTHSRPRGVAEALAAAAAAAAGDLRNLKRKTKTKCIYYSKQHFIISDFISFNANPRAPSRAPLPTAQTLRRRSLRFFLLFSRDLLLF